MSIIEVNDFFFGSGFVGNNGLQLKCQLRDIEPLTKRVSAEFYTAQLNRMLNQYGGLWTFNDDTSCPRFWTLIDKLVKEQVGFVEIFACEDVNDSVNATLGCDIVLVNGVIRVKAHWCAYKAIRAEEIVTTLLLPLHLKRLQDNVYIRNDNGVVEQLVVGANYQGELRRVFNLARYPDAISDSMQLQHYISMLQCATEVGDSGVESDCAWETFRAMHDNRKSPQ